MHTTKRFLLLTSCAWCIASVQSARADFTGLEVVDRTDLTICQDASEPEIPFKLDVCEVYAVFDDPADRLISVALTNVSTTAQQGFFQHTLGGNTAPACGLIALEPTVVCDSFVTLGVDCFDLIDGSTVDPDFDSTGFNSSGEVSGGWYNSAPPNGQGVPDADNRVLIARFSYKQNKNTTGDVCIFAQLGGSKDITSFLLLPFDCSVATGGLPSGEGPDLCPAGAMGSCREDNGTPGCDCPECCETVCAMQQSCCDVEWDQSCADLACDKCDLAACGECAGATGSCYEDHPTPGCDCPECCNLICCANPFCCDNMWESGCAQDANDPDTGCRAACSGTTQEIIYVDGDNQNMTKDGLSWDTAFTDLQDGLDLANCCGSVGEQVWVAKATNPYLPDRGTEDRNATFKMASGVEVLGGFPPGGGDLIDRLPDTHVTVLSGDLTGNDSQHACVNDSPDCDSNGGLCRGGFCIILDDNGENSHNVVTAKKTDDTAVLDGFTVTAGNDDSGCGPPVCPPSGAGAGVLILDGSPKLIDCTITANAATASGAGIGIKGGSPSVTDCDLTNNSAGVSGGGLHLADGLTTSGELEIQDCTVSSNHASTSGGGLYLKDTSATITGCTISSNAADVDGGGLSVDPGDVTIENCTISANEAEGGGGLFIAMAAAPRVEDCLFEDNSSSATDSGGGAIYNRGTPIIASCVFERNTAVAWGGALRNFGAPSIVNCVFQENTSAQVGGAVFHHKKSPATIVNGLFVKNVATSNGGAMYSLADSDQTVVNCTFSGNESEQGQGGGIFIVSGMGNFLTCHNTILWENIADGVMDEAAQISVELGDFDVTYTTIQGLVEEGSFDDDTNIGDDPSFVDAPNDDYHLSTGSPAIDHGDNDQVRLDVVDIDHDGDTAEKTPLDLDPKPRFMDDLDTEPDPGNGVKPVVDMGAYEFPRGDCQPCPTDVNDSGNTGPFDLAFLLGNWGPDITDPAVLCLDADGDFKIGPFDLAFLLGAWGPCE